MKEELIPVFIVSQLEVEQGGTGEHVGEAVPGLSMTVSHAEVRSAPAAGATAIQSAHLRSIRIFAAAAHL